MPLPTEMSAAKALVHHVEAIRRLVPTEAGSEYRQEVLHQLNLAEVAARLWFLDCCIKAGLVHVQDLPDLTDDEDLD